jgi:hypothetical protein
VKFQDPELAELMPWFSRVQRDFLQANSHALGYRFVDLTPALQQAAREYGARDLLYVPTNVHLSQVGNEVVARALADVLATDLKPQPTANGSPRQSFWRRDGSQGLPDAGGSLMVGMSGGGSGARGASRP